MHLLVKLLDIFNKYINKKNQRKNIYNICRYICINSLNLNLNTHIDLILKRADDQLIRYVVVLFYV